MWWKELLEGDPGFFFFFGQNQSNREEIVETLKMEYNYGEGDYDRIGPRAAE